MTSGKQSAYPLLHLNMSQHLFGPLLHTLQFLGNVVELANALFNKRNTSLYPDQDRQVGEIKSMTYMT